MRKGILISINPNEGSGKIIDANEQDIHCCLKDLGTNIQVGDPIIFNIKLTSYGLTAVDISKIDIHRSNSLLQEL
ncbi:hypothetical protein GJU39_21105 [Pedobacter petrophilus]|uniref:Uncharacterized protein n=1 Tax=Pedobacter petrophilus TaxID=1908241 RepID=A0A7K0G4L8_9SPHI|nr:hypothetical protein [Pedobacter petrophilus]MRX78582.1 hypothetical protein [Pedobacter petrophilus]